MKIAILIPFVFFLSACVADGTSNNTTTQQLGVTALKMAVNAKCTSELSNTATWKTASKLMTQEQQQSVQSNICGCVSDKAPQSLTAENLASVALDPNARTQIAGTILAKTMNSCIAEVLK